MKTKLAKVGIVILNFNGKEDTVECIHSIQLNNYTNYEILVVDNHSSDDSVEYITRNTRDIDIISLDSNTGYAGGNNVGISYFLENGVEFVLIINNDTTVDANFLSFLMGAIETKPSIGLVGPKIYYSGTANTLVSEGGKIDLMNGPFLNINQNKKDSFEFTKPLAREYISGCCILVRTSVFRQVGLLDEKYFCYVEDVDLCVRFNQASFDTVYVPSALIFHKTSKSTGGEINSTKEYFKSRNFIYFGKKYYLKPFNINYWKCMAQNRLHDSKMAILNRKFDIPLSIVRGFIAGVFYGR